MVSSLDGWVGGIKWTEQTHRLTNMKLYEQFGWSRDRREGGLVLQRNTPVARQRDTIPATWRRRRRGGIECLSLIHISEPTRPY